MPVRVYSTTNVVDAALKRFAELYKDGDRVIISFSGGKDSGVCLELAIETARKFNRLPVDVVMRDEEIMYPGTFEYAERVAKRPEVNFHWLIANQPVVNVFNRVEPYFWVFDPTLSPEDWVRQPPDYAIHITDLNIQNIVTRERFPTPEGKRLYNVMGLRASESTRRMLSIHSAKGFIAGPNNKGVFSARPIYDWLDDDVWKAILDNGWDYNKAYDTMYHIGIPKKQMRIAPPTMTVFGADSLRLAAHAWPKWFDRCCKRLPGLRSVANFGIRAIQPIKQAGETWESCFMRECIDNAPSWIAERATEAMHKVLAAHANHSVAPFPDTNACYSCISLGSWRELCKHLYNGDPFCLRATMLTYVEPEFFRPGSGRWNGTPNFA